MGILTESNDEDIVSQILHGDVDAFGALMQRYEPRLMRYVIYLIHDDAMASDVVQETFIKTYKNLHGFNSKYKFSSWIYRIAHNEAMNAIKHERKIVHDLDVEDIHEATYETNTIQDIDRAILQGDVKACLDNLPLKYREVLMLQYYEHMKYSEIADVMHMPPATVGVWAARGKAELKLICEQKGVKS
jgi:RNA polymerase sigma-70 factor (ECF subfamily)